MIDEKTKKQMFPEIVDWTESHDDLRFKNPNKMSYKEWFWFHHTAYKLIAYGMNVIAIVMFGFLMLYLIFIGLWIVGLLPGIVLVSNILSFIKKLRKNPKNMNFYDLHMREYKILEVK